MKHAPTCPMNPYRRLVRWLARREISDAEDRAFVEFTNYREAELDAARQWAYALATAPIGDDSDRETRARFEGMRAMAAAWYAPKKATNG